MTTQGLTTEQLAHLFEQGYVVVEDVVWSKDLPVLAGAVERVWEAQAGAGNVTIYNGEPTLLEEPFVLTDANGKTYDLTGDTKMLESNIGHKVRLSGAAGNTGGGELITAKGPQGTFGVKKVESLSATCK